MAMKTKVKQLDDSVIIAMDGNLDYEIQDPLRESLDDVLANSQKDATPKKIIFDLKGLEFVGSSGITNFIQTLKDFNDKAKIKPTYTNVKSEFKRMIRAFDDSQGFQIDESDERSKKRRVDN